MYNNIGPEGAIVRQMLRRPDQLSPSAEEGTVEYRLAQFVNRCIAVNRDQRPDTATECHDILADLLREVANV